MNDDLLTRLNAAATDEEREWLVLEFSLSALDEDVREAVWAAAIPHWFDVPFLAALLDKPEADIAPIFKSLIKLSFVELFPERGYNIHERSRTMLLKHSWEDYTERSRLFSERAAKYCAKQDLKDASWRIETIYHWLMMDDHLSVKAVMNQGLKWINYFEDNKVEALAHSILNDSEIRPVPTQAIAWAFYFRGYVYQHYSRYNDAKTAFELALGLQPDDELLKGNCHSGLGDIYSQLNKYEFARQQYEEALKTYRKSASRPGEANCIQSLGYIHYLLDEYQLARERLEEALQIYREIDSPLGKANCIQALAHISSILDEGEVALKLCEEALEIYRGIGERLGEGNCIKLMGSILERMNDKESARQKYEEALKIFRQINNNLGGANCLASLGDIDLSISEYLGATQKYEEALQIYQQIGSRIGEANCMAKLGGLQLYLGKYDEARTRFEQARQLNHQIGNLYGEANNNEALALTYMQLKEYKLAKQNYQEALSIFKKINYQSGIDACLEALEEVSDLIDE